MDDTIVDTTPKHVPSSFVKQTPEEVAVAFIQELRRQTAGQLNERQFNEVVMHGLCKGQEYIVTTIFNMGVDIDLSNPSL